MLISLKNFNVLINLLVFNSSVLLVSYKNSCVKVFPASYASSSTFDSAGIRLFCRETKKDTSYLAINYLTKADEPP